MKNIAILGSTGSIGRNSLEVIKNLPDQFRVTYLTANKNIELLQKQIAQFHPRGVVVLDTCNASLLQKVLKEKTEVLSGEEGLLAIVKRDDVDIVISSLVGFAGLKPTVEAIRHRKMVALANKETLVVAGQLMTSLVREYKARLIPIDSEHSAILQCLIGEEPSHIAKLILTASGGPFLNRPLSEFDGIAVEEALNHPKEGYDRLGDTDEQRTRGNRSPLVIQSPGRSDRSGYSPPVHYPLHGRIYRWVPESPAGFARYEDPDTVCPHVSGATRHERQPHQLSET